MSLLAPAAGLFGLTVPAIVALYLLKARRPPVVVSSTLLWRRATQDLQASVPWRRLRLSWLLVLQVLGAVLLTLALMGPAAARTSALAGHTIVVVDASATMQATDVAPNRFQAAVADARSLIGQLGPGQRLTLIAMDAHPRVLASSEGDPAPLERALGALRVTNGPADLQDTLSLASSLAGGGRRTRLVLLSDGVTEPLSAPLVLPFPVQYRRVGVSGENVGITALAVVGQGQGRQAVAHVANSGRLAQRRVVELRAGGRLVGARAIRLSPGAGQDVALGVPAGATEVSATLAPHDSLALDDSAVAVAGAASPLHIMLVTDGNPFLARALALRQGATVTTVSPAAYRPRRQIGLYVFDGFVPHNLPDAPAWLVGPPPGSRLAGPGGGDAPVGSGTVDPGVLRPASADDPLLTGVDLSQVHVARGARLAGSGLGRTVVAGDGGPVLVVRDQAPRLAVLGFDLHDSDLPLEAAFPVLVDNLSSYLAPSPVPPASQAPDQAVQLAAGPGARSVRITRPDGSVVSVPTVPGQASVVFTGTDQVGLYRVTAPGATRPVRSSFAVDPEPALSSIAPQVKLELAGTAESRPGGAGTTTTTDLWPWFALGALAVLVGEWWLFCGPAPGRRPAGAPRQART